MTAVNLSTTTAQPSKVVGSDDFLRRVLEDAELPALLPALAHATGDLRLLDESLRPEAGAIPAVPRPQGGMSPAAQEQARELALQALKHLRDEPVTPLDVTRDEDLMPLLTFMTGEANSDYAPLVNHELGYGKNGGDPDWTLAEIAPHRADQFSAIVVGAGAHGVQAAYRLKQAGIPVTVFEKNPDVGGTWYENSYPGCRLDTPNFTYSYSFLQTSEWPQVFTEQKHLYSYFSQAATELGVREHIQFGTEVETMHFDEETGIWTVTVVSNGERSTHQANIVVSAVGQLNRPMIPNIPGRETFKGEQWHTSHWRHDIDITGKRVAVIGTGATGIQVIPTIQPEVDHLTVFIRTPPWMYPAADYHDDIPMGMRWLLDNIPEFHRWYRVYQFYMNIEGRIQFMELDPEWEHDVSSSAKNDELREEIEKYIRDQFSDRPDLLPHVLPTYPPGAKRMLRDNGVWATALKSDNVTLVHNGIDHITEEGIVDRDGVLHPLDVIVYGTGFKASDFLYPMKITTSAGIDLHETWAGDLQAYYGVNVPEFPNLFLLYGPNTNLVVNGSLTFLQEMAVEFIMGQLKHLLATGSRSIEIQREPFDSYNDWVDEGNAKMAWSDTRANTWYRNVTTGRSSQNWPFPMLDYWKGTHEWDPDIFKLQ